MKTKDSIIYIGQKYGHLTVVGVDNYPKVDCVCDCGRSHVATISNLRRGNTKSCGCSRPSFVKEWWQSYRSDNSCRNFDDNYDYNHPHSISNEKKTYIESFNPVSDLGREMQSLWANGMTLKQIAYKYGYSTSWVHKQITGE